MDQTTKPEADAGTTATDPVVDAAAAAISDVLDTLDTEMRMSVLLGIVAGEIVLNSVRPGGQVALQTVLANEMSAMLHMHNVVRDLLAANTTPMTSGGANGTS